MRIQFFFLKKKVNKTKVKVNLKILSQFYIKFRKQQLFLCKTLKSGKNNKTHIHKNQIRSAPR